MTPCVYRRNPQPTGCAVDRSRGPMSLYRLFRRTVRMLTLMASRKTRSASLLLLGVTFLFVATSANGLSPQEVFEKTSQSIFIIHATDDQGKVTSQGSGVLVGKDTVVTNCHVVTGARRVSALRQGRAFGASVLTADTERDLCILNVTGAGEPTIKVVGTLETKTGQRVYAIGAPLGLELTISEGLVSSLRQARAGFILQTSAAISPGSSGGGLFDENGDLLGITTFQLVSGQNLNFAIPGEWIAEARERQRQRERQQITLTKYREAAGLLKKENKWNALQELAERAIKVHDVFDIWVDLGEGAYKRGNLKRARQALEHAVSLKLDNLNDYAVLGIAYVWLSEIYNKLGEPNNELAALGESILYLPDKLFFGNFWSRVTETNSYSFAAVKFKRAVEIFPRSPDAWAYLGASYLNLKKDNEAIDAFKQSVQLDIENDWAWPWRS